MIKTAVAGVAGKMGGIIARLVFEAADLELVGATESPGHNAVGKTVEEALGLKGAAVRIESDIPKAVKNAEVFINFTSPEASVSAIEVCSKKKVACVVGTTGLTQSQIDKLRTAAKNTPVVFSPNMSLGVNLLKKLVEQATAVLGDDYDIEIVETHHKLKADAPSGTALLLAKAAAEVRKLDFDKAAVYGRQGRTGARPKDQIGVMTLRGGDIVGEHTVLFAGPGERIELIHRAHSRETFARGAIRAARWVTNKKPGFYSMADVLGLT